jgi:uncharacterized RDD family membrane protein YckC
MTEKYPILLRRYLATLVDFLVAFSIAVAIGKTLSVNGELSYNASWWIIVLPFLIYEPILTTVYSTFGQFVFRFRVRKLDEKNKINLGQAFIRVIIKYLLGWISLMTIPARGDRRAMHDLATGSIVVNSNNNV